MKALDVILFSYMCPPLPPPAVEDICSYTGKNIILPLSCLSFIPGGGELEEMHLEGVTDILRKRSVKVPREKFNLLEQLSYLRLFHGY